MQACDLHPQEEGMALDLLKGLTEVISINSGVVKFGEISLFFIFATPNRCLSSSFLCVLESCLYFPLGRLELFAHARPLTSLPWFYHHLELKCEAGGNGD